MITSGGTTTLGLYDFKRQVDSFGGVNYFQSGTSYLPNARVMLANGEIVQNSTNGNLTNDPNVNMTGWVNSNSASKIFDASGKNQQEINTFLKKRIVKSKQELIDGIDGISNGDIVLLTSLALGEYSGGGEFKYDSSLAAVNDGYMVINGFKRVFNDGMVQLEWFGGKPFTDCTSAFNDAITWLKNNPIRTQSYSRGGYYGIQLNGGVYLVGGTIQLINMSGLQIKGLGIQSTTLIYMLNSGTLFNIVGYSNFKRSDMTIQCGTYDPITEYVTPFTTFGSLCNDFDGTNGGTKYLEDNIRYVGWDRVYKTTKTTINCDMHSYSNVFYENNNVVWENSNANAVSWSFINPYTYGIREAVFLNPCNTTRVDGGDHINPATFFKVTVGSHGSSCKFNGLRFEYWKNKEGIVGEFKYLDVTAMTQGTVFENCSTFGLPANADTIKTGNLKSYFDIKFKNCKLYGTWDAQGDTYSRASKSMLTFEECLKVPAINHVYGEEAVKSPIGVNYIRQNTQEGYPNSGTTVNRYYRGAVLGVGSHLAISKEPMIDTFSVREFVNTNTFTYTFPVWNVNPFTLQLAKIRLALHKNSLATPLTIKFFSDSIKTMEIANYTFNAPISQAVLIYSIVDILPASFTSTPVFSGGNSNIYMELSSTGNAGTCYVTCEFEYIHVGFS